MRHFAQNFYMREKNKDCTDALKLLCCELEPHLFQQRLAHLKKVVSKEDLEFLEVHLEFKEKWACAFDVGGARYSHMTSNMAEIFNVVLKGIRRLPVAAIPTFTFDKCNEYWISRWSAIRRAITTGHTDGDGNRTDRRWPRKVSERIESQQIKFVGQLVKTYDPVKWHYSVQEAGGQSIAGEPWGGRIHEVDLQNETCTCRRKMVYHEPCSHLMRACRQRNVHWYNMVSPYYTIDVMELTWSTKFKPYLEPARWPTYSGDEFRPDPALVITTRGRRQSKRFKMEMDKMKHKRNKFDAFLYETRMKNRCTVCHKTGHINNKKFTCEMRQAEAAKEAVRGQGALGEGVSTEASGNMRTGTVATHSRGGSRRRVGSRRAEAEPRAEWAM
jgi:hypothetical protein